MNFRNAAIGAGGLFCAAGMAVTIAGAAQAAPPGNNGTVKIHELGTEDHTESNDPHVCKFNLEYYNQDASQEGFEAKFFTQAPTQPKDQLALTIQMPQAGADGYSESFYVNADPNGETDGTTLAAGHYMVIVYGKNGDAAEEKAKSKVFWVDCQDTTTPPTSSSSTPPESSSTPPESSSTPPESSSTPPESSSTPPESSSTPPESSSTPPESSSTPPESSTPRESSTPPEQTTSTAVPPAGSTTPPGSSGPVVVTDGPSGGGGDNTTLLGGGLAAVGVALAGAGLLRRRMND